MSHLSIVVCICHQWMEGVSAKFSLLIRDLLLDCYNEIIELWQHLKSVVYHAVLQPAMDNVLPNTCSQLHGRKLCQIVNDSRLLLDA